MKSIICLLLLSGLVHSQTWNQLNDFPSNERDDGVAAVINNVAYIGTGLANVSGISNDFYKLDLATNTWTVIASMPAGSNRQYASAFTYSNFLFVTCGITTGNTVLNDTYRYDVATNTWTNVTSKPGSPVWGASSFTLGNKAYVSGGKFSSGTVSNEVWEYDMQADIWTQKNNFPFGGRWRASSAALNNTPYMIFGLDNNSSYRKEIYKYTQSTDTWSKVTDFPQPYKGRVYAAMQGLQNSLVIFGGHDTTGQYFNDCWFFDEVNGFTQGPLIPSLPRKGGMSFANGNKFYYTCGVNNTPARIKETWMLDVPVGIKEYSAHSNINIYPVPFKDQFTLHGLSQNSTMEIFDDTGNKVLEKRIDKVSETIDLSGLRKGVYLLRLNDEKNFFTKKIIKD